MFQILALVLRYVIILIWLHKRGNKSLSFFREKRKAETITPFVTPLMTTIIDTGSNITSLGYFWLSLKYLLPVFIGFILIASVAIGAYIGYHKLPVFSENKTTIFVLALVSLALIALLS